MLERQIEKSGQKVDKEGRGPNIPDDWKIYIMEQATKQSLKPRKLLAVELLEQMEKSRERGDKELPEKESIAKLISTARKHKSPLDEPWSLGASVENNIPSEATGGLLAVWNHCLAIGHVFTIREARWVARLRPIFAGRDSRIGELFAHAYEYAIRERICEMLNQPFDTIDLDAQLCIDERERYVYRSLGLVPKIAVPYHQREKEMGHIAYWDYLVWAKQAATNIAFNHIPKAAKGTGETNELGKLFRHTENLPGGQDRIYAALLLFLTKGPKWDALSAQEYLQILSELRKCVTEVISPEQMQVWEYEKQVWEYEILDSKGGLKPTDIMDPALLEAVGYEVDTKMATKEAQHERAHSQEG